MRIYNTFMLFAELFLIIGCSSSGTPAEPSDIFINPSLTGRFFHVQLDVSQDSYTGVILDTSKTDIGVKLSLQPFGQDNEWGVSIPDISPGSYHLLLTADKAPGPDDDNNSNASAYFDFQWPPDDNIVALPKGQGIFVYNGIDPDSNALCPPNETINKFQNFMGGDFVILMFADIKDDGHFGQIQKGASAIVKWMTLHKPELPVLLWMYHGGNDYPLEYFENLYDDIVDKILANPDYSGIAGIQLDEEIYPASTPNLEDTYKRYAEFMAKLHLSPSLKGRIITIYDFCQNPLKMADNCEILKYLSTADAFMAACYYEDFTWRFNISESATFRAPVPFDELRNRLQIYKQWSNYYGRPYYPIVGNYGGLCDTWGDTLCVWGYNKPSAEIDDLFYMRTKSIFGTSNEYDVARSYNKAGKVQQVQFSLPEGPEFDIYENGGLVVFRIGKPAGMIGDDFVYCRTAYSMSKAYETINSSNSNNSLMPGMTLFRFETNHNFKAAAINTTMQNDISSSDFAVCAGRILFNDSKGIAHHNELWGKISIELVNPSPEVLNNPAYRKSMDIVGTYDGSYIFPDLPRGNVTLRATALGTWRSEYDYKVDLSSGYGSQNITLVLK